MNLKSSKSGLPACEEIINERTCRLRKREFDAIN